MFLDIFEELCVRVHVRVGVCVYLHVCDTKLINRKLNIDKISSLVSVHTRRCCVQEIIVTV